MAIRRRSIATAIVALVLVGVAGAVWWQPAKQQQQPGFGGGGGGDDGPVPVVAALAKRSDVPVYLDGVGTIRALNTVTVRSQVDGKLSRANYTEGQQVERGYVLAGSAPQLRRGTGGRQLLCVGADRPDDLSGLLRSGGGEEVVAVHTRYQKIQRS